MANAPLLVFDIETIPDLSTGKRLYPEIAQLSDNDAMTALVAMREAEVGNPFMVQPLHEVACFSYLWMDGTTTLLGSFSQETMSESQILARVLNAFAKKPVIISWNGAGFDLPVLLYRMAHHQLNARAITHAGFKEKDYLNRYSSMHIDLMDKFSFGAWGNKQKLDVIASLCGFAGKGEIDGRAVLPMVQTGQWRDLEIYCESDVLNTYLVYLRYQLLIGMIDHQEHDRLYQALLTYLKTLVNSDGQLRHGRFFE